MSRPTELRRDPLAGHLVALAPGRARRPGAPGRTETAAPEPRCPFCEGREDETPPETFALPAEGREPDTPGWLVRVVPNKYPALAGGDGVTEVVVHSPRHELSLGSLASDELAAVAGAWRARADVAREQGFSYVHALLNEGRAAGGSLSHSHSQLVWLRDEPPSVLTEQRSGTSLADLLASEQRERARVVLERDGVIAVCPYASRAPYELLVAPLEPQADAFGSEQLPAAIALLAAAIARLRRLEGAVPLNAWLHTRRFGASDGHWHLELLPRLTVAAGLELGAGIYVNPLAPEEAAAALRKA